jgi:LasA protease
MHLKKIWILGTLLILTACSRPWTESSYITPVSIWSSGQVPTSVTMAVTATVSYNLPIQRLPGSPILTPTPDSPHFEPDLAHGPETYVVKPGDILSAIAERYNVSLEALIQVNKIANPDSLEVGMTLAIPAVTPQPPGPDFKIIPDSELVYGPMSASFDIGAFIDSKAGYLAGYTQEVNGEILNSTQIVQRIAQDYSVNPRLLLAVLEYRSSWVTNPNPDPSLADIPFGFSDAWYVGLYRQLAWAAIQLNNGYYLWRTNSITEWVLKDGSVVPITPTINAGTAAVQNFFAHLDDYSSWLRDVSSRGFFDQYSTLFGYPFDFSIEPIVPANLTQPRLHLPFPVGETWFFTGGPHLSWDAGSPYGALDFAPPDAADCNSSQVWVTAVADGVVTRTGVGTVVQDLDGDGNEGSGWVIVYYHIESRDRVQNGSYLHAGDQVGHASCEGGIYTGAHVHLARKFNGEWIPVIRAGAPFVMDGWIPEGTGEEYVGTLNRNGTTIVNLDGKSETNQIQR